MKKVVTVIIGKSNVGKTLMSKGFALNNQEKTKFIFCTNKTVCEHFFFSSCEEDTEVIIIDEVVAVGNVEKIVWLAQSDITVEKQSKKAFTIAPKEIVIVCEERITRESLESLGASFYRRIKLIEIINH